MEINFNGIRVIAWKIICGHIVPVVYKVKLWMINIHPHRNLSACYKMNCAYPGHEFLYATEQVSEHIPVPVSLITVIRRV